MKKILLVMLCTVFLLSHGVVLHAADTSGSGLGWLTVEPDIGIEAHMAEAEELAAGEWWKFFWGVAVLMVIAIIVSYVRYSHNIWAANVNGQHEKVKKLKLTRHIVAAAWVVIAAAGLMAVKLYMKPYNVKYETGTYNTMYWNEVQEGLGDYAKTGNVTLDLVVRRSIFDLDNVFGTAVVDETKYVVFSDNTVEEGNIYTLYLKEEGGSILDLGVIMNSTKDFEMFIYRDSSISGANEFVGPAETVEEAKSVSESFSKLK